MSVFPVEPRDRSKRFTPEVFAEIFDAEEGPLIVGGQAVNIWANYYAERSEMLARKAPFTSVDADVVLSLEAAKAFARRHGWSFEYFPDFRQTAIGVLRKKTDGGVLLVDVMRSVLGVGRKDMDEPFFLEAFPGKRWKVLDPIVLLKAKMTNLAQLGNRRGDGTERSDQQQAVLLVTICDCYLREFAAMVKANAGQGERELINDFAALKDIVENPLFITTATKFGVALASALPRDIDTGGLPKLENFYRHQLAGTPPPQFSEN